MEQFSLRIFFGLLAFTLVACERETVVLRFASSTNQHERYHLKSNMDLVVDEGKSHPQGIGSQLFASLDAAPLSHYDDGSARYHIQVDSVQYQSKSRTLAEQVQIQKALQSQMLEFQMGPAGEMQDLKMDAFVPELEGSDIDLKRLLIKIQPVLPGSPVAVGDTWERQQLIPESEGQQVFVYKWFQVEEIYRKNQQRLVRLSMNIRYKPKANSLMAPTTNDFILGSGFVIFNETQGQVQEAKLEINGLLNVLSKSKDTQGPSYRIRQIIHLKRL